MIGKASSSHFSPTSRSTTATPSSPVSCACLSAAMVRRNSSSAFATSFGGLKAPFVPVLRLAEQRTHVLFEHGERRIGEAGLQVGGLRDQDRGAACRFEIGNVLHRHDGALIEEPAEAGGLDSPR